MISTPPARDKETQALIERFESRRKRRRVLRVGFTASGGALVLALVVVAVALATRGSGEEITAESSEPVTISVSTSIAAADQGGYQPTPTTYHRVSTTVTPGSSESTTTTVKSSTTTSSTTTSSTTSTTIRLAAGFVVCIDPGHQLRGDSSTEPIGPGSSEMKIKTSDGTAGVATGVAESELVLTVSLRLRDALVARGVRVVMTRTTQDVRLSNIERAQIANNAGANLFVRVHADGSENGSTHGIHVLYPLSIKGWTDDIAAASKQAATLAQRELIAATGAVDLGIDARGDMTGFNWCDVPVILPEIGFMSNAAEDRLLATPAYQDKIVEGLTRAILAFLGAG